MVRWRRREEVIGKEVIDGDAKKIGMTKDIAWSEDGKLALVIESKDNEFILPFPGIEKVGDVVFVKPKDSLLKVPSITCSQCETKNLQEAKFCAKCGHKLEAEPEQKG
jgi:sporulation protein YlmC with PRC-barrel domain